MARRIVFTTPTEGASPVKETDASALPSSDVSIDGLLKQQLLALARVTHNLLKEAPTNSNKDYVQSLATCIKLTMELKVKEKDLLDSLTDEELKLLMDEE